MRGLGDCKILMSFLKSSPLKTLQLIYHMIFLVEALFAPLPTHPPPSRRPVGGGGDARWGVCKVISIFNIGIIFKIPIFANPRIDIT